MNLKLNRLVLSLLASVAVLPKSALAFTTAVGSQLKTDKSDLTKQLIEKKMFLINPETDEIVLDESKILRTIRE